MPQVALMSPVCSDAHGTGQVLALPHLHGAHVAVLLHPIVVHEDISQGCPLSSPLDRIGEESPDFLGPPDTESPLSLLAGCSSGVGICIFCAVKTSDLGRKQQRCPRCWYNIPGLQHSIMSQTG